MKKRFIFMTLSLMLYMVGISWLTHSSLTMRLIGGILGIIGLLMLLLGTFSRRRRRMKLEEKAGLKEAAKNGE